MIVPIMHNKKEFLDLLLLGDEQENMIDKYLERGEIFALYSDDEVVATCVITDEGQGVLEIKNLATKTEHQRKGYAHRLIIYVVEKYTNSHHTLLVGTGDSPLTIPFYRKCGFTESHRVKNFFIDNYDHPYTRKAFNLLIWCTLKESFANMQ